MKQITMVLNAVNDGCETSREVADLTGLSIPTVANYLNELTQLGSIRRVKRNAISFNGGTRHHLYGPAIACDARVTP